MSNAVVAPVPLAEHLSNSRTVGKNAIWNLLGRSAPMLVAVAVTPHLIKEFGVDRWGVFTIALSLVGAFGMFDFGIGRALTRNVAGAIGAGVPEEVASQAKTSLLALLILGSLGGLVMASVAGYWVASFLKVPAALLNETRISIYLLCFAAPFVVLSSGLWGIVSAFQMQKAIAIWGTPLMVMYYIGPLLAFRIFHSLVAPISVILILRLAGICFFGRLSVLAMPALVKAPIRFAALKPILKLSGWITVSNVIWPILSYLDRVVIASFVSAAATGYYSTSGDVITRLTLIPNSISSSAFPAVAASHNSFNSNTCRVIRRSLLAAISAVLPVSLVLLLFGDVLLRLWLGRDFASHSAQPFRWFSLGLIFYSADMLTGGIIEALGHPDINAKVSIAELVIFVPAFAVAVKLLGLPGAAELWCLRGTVELCLRFGILHRLLPQFRSSQFSITVAVTSAGLIGSLCFLPSSIPSKAMALLAGLTSYFSGLWLFALTDEDKLPVRQRLLRLSLIPRQSWIGLSLHSILVKWLR